MEDGVTERAPARRDSAPREAVSDGSRGMGLRPGEFRAAIGRTKGSLLLVTAIGLVAALLMILAEFSTIASVELTGLDESCETQLVDPGQRDDCELNGFDRHGGALILLGLITGAMALGAGLGGSRPAAAALILLGLVVLGITLGLDLPKTDETGAIGASFEGAKASAGAGFYLELLGGLAALAAGGLRLMQREGAG
jgi:hypothetical protein